MKYLAILKDSLRETIDAKVFYVMLGLSGLLILLVASLSFRPVPAEEALQSIVSSPSFLTAYRDRGRSVVPANSVFGPLAMYKVTDIEKLTDAPEPQAADYRFTLVAVDATEPGALEHIVTAWNRPADEEGKGKDADKVPDSMLADFIKDQFAVAGNIQVTRVEKRELPKDLKDQIETLMRAQRGLRRAPEADPNGAGQGGPSTLPVHAFVVETKGARGARGWQHDPCLFFGALPLPIVRGFTGGSLGGEVYWIEDYLVNGMGAWIGILVGVVITAFFIPNMLRKGTIDLLLVKPIHRWALLVYKYIGGLSFMFLNAAVVIVGIWLALGWRSGIWAPGFLLSILILTFFFAILYAVSTLCGVLTRSVIVPILVTVLVWAVLFVVGSLYSGLDPVKKEPAARKNVPEWLFTTVDTAHFLLPRTNDLVELTTQVLSREVLTDGEIRARKLDHPPAISWGESLTASGVFVALVLGLACWWFSIKDY